MNHPEQLFERFRQERSQLEQSVEALKRTLSCYDGMC